MNRLITALFAALLMLACQKHTADAVGDSGQTGKMGVIDPKLAESSNRFGFNLLRRVVSEDPDATVMVSPASVAMAMSMALNGAAGMTRTQMAQILEVDGLSSDDLNRAHQQLRETLTDPNGDVALAIANSLWARTGMAFKEGFLARNRDYFAAEIANLDFSDPASTDVINAWVDKNTKSKIPTIIDKIDPAAILYLINAIYFKGTWTYTFDPELTSDQLFHHPSGDKSRPFMQQEGDFDYLDGDGFRGVRLPYGKSGRFAMYVLLPDEGLAVSSLTTSITDSVWGVWIRQFAQKRGVVKLPRFTVTDDLSLADFLKAMGMNDAFYASNADFSEMITVPGENVYISAVKHKTFMQVNEEGTEAAAVTSVEVVVTSIREPEDMFEMIVDRPFACAVADKESGMILFMGMVNEFE